MIFSRLTLARVASLIPISSLSLSLKLPSQHPSNHPFTVLKNHLVGPTILPRTFIPFSTSSQDATLTATSEGKVGISPENLHATVDGEGLPAVLRRELMPRHVAFILDGNKRWAERRGLESVAGHDAGLHTLLNVMGLCSKWDVQVATFFLFSSENWSRPKHEIDFIMKRFEKMLIDELENIVRQGIRILTIGDTSTLPNSLQQVLEQTKEATKHNTKTQVIFAISYSGKNDIVEACRSIATKATKGEIEPKDVTMSLIEQELQTKITSSPSPDLVIRTSGEVRISNFLLWQMAYSELYFTKTLWPDFAQADFIEALQSFQKRARRFGRH